MMGSSDPSSAAAGSSPSALASFVRAHEPEILGAWAVAVAERPAMRGAAKSTLPERVSPLVTAIGRAPDDFSTFESVGRELAFAQFARGVELTELVAQYSILRDILIERWSGAAAPSDVWPGAGVICRANDAAVSSALAASTEMRARSLSTIQSLSLAVLENVTLDELLQRLLAAFQELAPAVQAAAFYLREDDQVLRLHTSFGLLNQDARGATVKVGEGFLGQIASEKHSRLARVPSAEPVVPEPWTKMRVVHGLPLLVRGHLVGLAVMGSDSSWEFAKADQIAFDVVARQATDNIYDWKVRESIDSQKARLDALLEQLPAGVILGEAPSGKLILHNAQVEAIWRRPFIDSANVEEYRGWPIYHQDGRRLEPREFPLARAVAGSATVNEELEILRGDGTRGTVLCNAAPIRTADGRTVGGVTTFVDITEKRSLELQLKEIAAQAQSAETVQQVVAEASIQLAESFHEGSALRSIVSLAVPQIADGCAVFSISDGHQHQLLELADVDPRRAALARALLERRSALARALLDIADRVCRTQKPEIVPHVTEELLRGDSVSEEELAMFRELGLRSLMVFPLVARGHTLGALALATSRSRKEFSHQDFVLAQELTRRSAFAIDNERLYQEAQQAVRLREEVLEVISHDLRGPLNSVHLSAEVLRTPEASQDSVRKRAEQILAAAARMERLIRDLMDLAAIRSGRLSIEREPTDVPQLVLQAFKEYEDSAGRAGVTLEHDVEPGLSRVHIDRERILQALGNLISNALKVTAPGRAVTVRVVRRNGDVLFTVTDAGLGIPAEDIPRLFDRYFRGKSARGSGLGLGLPITRAIVEGHGGRIWVESTVGKGSVFSFTVPPGV
jgi:signal transduction histidine kinase/PAS domain-containing protein